MANNVRFDSLGLPIVDDVKLLTSNQNLAELLYFPQIMNGARPPKNAPPGQAGKGAYGGPPAMTAQLNPAQLALLGLPAPPPTGEPSMGDYSDLFGPPKKDPAVEKQFQSEMEQLASSVRQTVEKMKAEFQKMQESFGMTKESADEITSNLIQEAKAGWATSDDIANSIAQTMKEPPPTRNRKGRFVKKKQKDGLIVKQNPEFVNAIKDVKLPINHKARNWEEIDNGELEYLTPPVEPNELDAMMQKVVNRSLSKSKPSPLVPQLVALLSIYMPPEDFQSNPIVGEARKRW